MKICILATGYPRYRGDFDTIYLHSLAKELVKQGAEVHVVTPHARGSRKEESMDSVQVHRFQYMYPSRIQTLAYFPGIPENIKRFHNKVEVAPFVTAMAAKMLTVVRRYDIDIVNAHWAIPSGFLGVLTRKLHRKPVMLTLYGAELYLAKRASLFQGPLKYALAKADKVVGISDATCQTARTISHREDIEFLPDGIDTEHFSPFVGRDEVRQRFGMNGHPIIFASGRMVERKGFKYLLEAMPHILQECPQARLVIGGDGPEKEKLKALINKLGLTDHVTLPGFISEEEFPFYMSASDVFVLPSIVDDRGDTEGSATIMLEAMACGTPVVGTKVGGIPCAIKDGEGGYLVDEKSPEQLAEKVTMLLRNGSLRRELGEIGSKYVEENFSQAKIANRYIGIYQTLTQNRNGPR